MKKIFVLLALAISATAFAGPSFQVEYQDEKNETTNKTSQAIAWTLKNKLSDQFSGDVGGTTSQQDSNYSLGQRLEVGLTYEPVKWAYTRVAVGEKFSNTSRNSYYSVEPGVKFPIYGNVSGKLAYRYRNAFDTTTYNTQRENTYRAGLSYQINPANAVGVGYDYTTGSADKSVWKVNYTYNF
jgi:opacity protein-like surface antigen